MVSSQSVLALPASALSGFSAVPSVGSPSAFVGIEGTAQNCIYRLHPFGFVFRVQGFCRKSGKTGWFSSCSASTTATNGHNCPSPVPFVSPEV